MPAKPRRETDLYLPVKNLFAGRNYKIRAEVNGCDLVAVKDQEMVIVELKTSVNIRLLTQAVERLSITPMVYIAVPEPSRKRNSHWRGIIKLLKMLGLGLILVTFGPAGARAGIAFDPGARQPSRNIKKIKNLKREFEGRSADHNTGGSNRSPLMTSYEE
ncbi:MAG: DUF2161 family putative PD-(D/E)XK-type phosphodiesterase, partial [Gammaproteobacteria bacterium]|nr:DUF2161 family putative PD-(D/E)XK-type phosphodiesterase [Gammaproteobacteria bacterium]